MKYGNLDHLPPTTDRGSYRIDSIFISPDLIDIIAGGWLPISNGLSDHRVLYIDISIKTLLGKFKNSTRPYTIRRLKCRDDKAVAKYNMFLERQYHDNNTMAKIEEFHQLKQNPLSATDKHRLARIDKVCTQAVIHAERHCRNIFAGGKPYTPELNRLGRQIDTWRMIIKKKLGRNISTRRIKRAAMAHGIPNPQDIPLEACYNF